MNMYIKIAKCSVKIARSFPIHKMAQFNNFIYTCKKCVYIYIYIYISQCVFPSD